MREFVAAATKYDARPRGEMENYRPTLGVRRIKFLSVDGRQDFGRALSANWVVDESCVSRPSRS